MARACHEAFRRAGFSEDWLRSAPISPTVNKQALLMHYYRGEAPVLVCNNCKKLYLDHEYVSSLGFRRTDYREGGWELYCSGKCWNKSPEYQEWRREIDERRQARMREWQQRADDSEAAFYTSPEWREIRYAALLKYGSKCRACGRTVMKHGAVMHVDHVCPRSRFPELALDLDNLQVLCERCNMGKGAHQGGDWRGSQ